MPRPLGLTEHTLFAELLDRSLDAMFDERFPENGTFVKRRRQTPDGSERAYWYYQGYRPGPADLDVGPKRYSLYVGPTDDPAITGRVEQFKELKADRAERGRLVDALCGAGMPRPQLTIGKIVDGLAKAGLFRLRGVLVGTAAYQTYGGLVGARLGKTAAMTGDVDFAQFRSISVCVKDTTAAIIDVLRGVDPTFKWGRRWTCRPSRGLRPSRFGPWTS